MFSNKGEDGEIFFLMYRTISVQFMMAYNLVLPISPCLVKIILFYVQEQNNKGKLQYTNLGLLCKIVSKTGVKYCNLLYSAESQFF